MRRKNSELKPKKIMDSDVRKAVQLEYLSYVEITQLGFELLDLVVPRRHTTHSKMESLPDWMRPLASIYKRYGDTPGLFDAVRAGLRGDWVSVDMFLMGYEE